MRVKSLEILGFKSFARKSVFEFESRITSIVGPNGSGKSNVAEALRFVLGEQSLKSMRGKRMEDLIWNGSKSVERQNRARVTITFDNSDHAFPVDYNEVSIGREIYRDSSSEYFLNGSSVRLKDVIELLSAVHIGASGHHIISQGEADRILNSTPRDRRSMIEDALGLKVYHWKISESEKKLVRTEENMRQTESLRREIAPHIKFLKKQVEKVEQARNLRDELRAFYMEYLKREELYLSAMRIEVQTDTKELEHSILALDEELARVDSERAVSGVDIEGSELLRIRTELGTVRRVRDDLGRKIGRLEGMIEYEERRVNTPVEQHHDKMISAQEAENIAQGAYEELGYAESSEDYLYIKGVVSRVRHRVGQFLEHIRGTAEQEVSNVALVQEIEGLRHEKDVLVWKQNELEGMISHLEIESREIEKRIDEKRLLVSASERASFELRAKKQELTLKLGMVHDRIEYLTRDEVQFKEELREGGILVGRTILDYVNTPLNEDEIRIEPRQIQEDRRKKIERLKIRLEDIMGGGTGEDVVREYEETVARDGFLEKELEDLKISAESLRGLMKELEETLTGEFKEGVSKINKQFSEFFALMFNGGSATLQVSYEKKKKKSDTEITDSPSEEDEEAGEEGIEVAITLPHKKIRGLQMLSGGERALTSIALLFAISQVNPPPFLVLDETDAALDEANSKKYGDMIENLAKYSQLIVITHNRETMSRAGVIYGVTMGADAISKLLSIKFEEAARMAK